MRLEAAFLTGSSSAMPSWRSSCRKEATARIASKLCLMLDRSCVLRLAQAVHDILKPGGLFAIVSWYARPREETTVLGEPRGPATQLRMTPEQTIVSVEPGGLKFRNRVEVSPYHYGAVFERPR
jgi:hypothetical protein